MASHSTFYMHRAISTAHPLFTRQAAGGQIRLGNNFDSKQELLHDGFRYRVAKDYNSIPASIRSVGTLPTLKLKLEMWVLDNIPVG